MDNIDKVFLSLVIVWFAFWFGYVYNKTHTVTDNIYNELSNDNWGTSTDRDTIDEEYKVVLTKGSLTITELVPGSVFFTKYVKGDHVRTISLPLEDGRYKSTEYWAKISMANKKLLAVGDSVDYAFVQGTHGMIRIVFDVSGLSRDEVFYFWPAGENRK